ncbi:hypothetical protein EVAR_40108_1 [Eumeta japonica]|uniref:Uncharacterized protein n=1 Tax=Eumeta variegata TaxID=151549 RepID=A0A4C1WAL8_EUMVA|nr:hypothetical protein EVAR_40108_1 [Eumeta japonica]
MPISPTALPASPAPQKECGRVCTSLVRGQLQASASASYKFETVTGSSIEIERRVGAMEGEKMERERGDGRETEVMEGEWVKGTPTH